MAVGLALVFVFLVLSTIKQKSPTFDEPLHLLGGYSYLKWRDYRVNPEHPPLAKVLAALPLLAFDVKDPRPGNPDWDQILTEKPGIPTAQVAREMFFVRNDAETLFYFAKLPFVVLALTLGLFIFLWSRQWFGSAAAVASVALFASDPNIVAHSSLVHTDVAFTAFFFIGTYFFQRSLFAQRRSDRMLACVLFSLAAITKFSSVGIVLSWGAMALMWIVAPDFAKEPAPIVDRRRTPRLLRVSGLFLGMAATAYLFIWAAYRFQFEAVPGGPALDMAQVMPHLPSPLLQGLVGWAGRLGLFPEAWIYGELYNVTLLRRTAFLLGEISNNGFWLYFPIAFLVKTPVPTLILVALAAIGLLTRRDQSSRQRLLLWIPALVYFSIAVGSRMNIGLRHVLPVYPFLFVLAGESAAGLWSSRILWKRGCLVFVAAWALWGSIGSYPHYLAFFNEFAGGAKNGHKILIDSNLDWGQDLKGLRSWMDDNGAKRILLLYFGLAEPAYYGMDAVHLPGSLIPPRISTRANFRVPYTFAVSANYFYGSEIYATKSEAAYLKSFRLKEPVATIGHSILVFNLEPSDPHVNYSLGRIMASRGELQAAEYLFRKAMVAAPSFAAAHEELAQVLARQKKFTEADRHRRQAATIRDSRP
jgi:hypothetical protein